jgi:hypothetical protein
MKRKMQNIKTLKPHVSLNVRNVEKSVEFNQQLFVIKTSKIRTGYAKFDTQNPPLNLALNEVASTEDVLKNKARWEEIGLLTRDQMQTSC